MDNDLKKRKAWKKKKGEPVELGVKCDVVEIVGAPIFLC